MPAGPPQDAAPRRPLKRRWIIAAVVLLAAGTLAWVAASAERAGAEIDLTREQAPFHSLELPLKRTGMGTFTASHAGPGLRKAEGISVSITDAAGRMTTIYFPKGTPGAGSIYQESLDGDLRPMKDPLRVKEICLHLLSRQEAHPTDPLYYQLAEEKPPSRFMARLLHTLGFR